MTVVLHTKMAVRLSVGYFQLRTCSSVLCVGYLNYALLVAQHGFTMHSHCFGNPFLHLSSSKMSICVSSTFD